MQHQCHHLHQNQRRDAKLWEQENRHSARIVKNQINKQMQRTPNLYSTWFRMRSPPFLNLNMRITQCTQRTQTRQNQRITGQCKRGNNRNKESEQGPRNMRYQQQNTSTDDRHTPPQRNVTVNGSRFSGDGHWCTVAVTQRSRRWRDDSTLRQTPANVNTRRLSPRRSTRRATARCVLIARKPASCYASRQPFASSVRRRDVFQ